ncbi:uncharacterized protein LOC117580935 [Drosophila guanche]|uniref:Uncharacterized protein n=1 Tax=Drosophila guanche TaxID=7266 RepID=A0A3B0J992_DROGU|nr:uncharacterized protein LOC117580935 [Drosophila guanche]SPP78475.1 Hypothetical predicted protein [Drosophila guanche]
MSEGFKKHFNATTVNGRANVAKATYATMALLYVVYRIRRRSGKKPAEGGGSDGGSILADGSCSCDKEREPAGDSGFYETDPECGSCRERSERAMTEYDREQQRRSAAKARQENKNECKSDPPPPSSSGGAGAGAGAGAATPRRKCPCDNPHQKSSSNEAKAYMQRQQQRSYGYQFPQDTDDVRPASELAAQVHGAIYSVLSGIYNSVMGRGSAETATTATTAKQRQASGGGNCVDTAAGQAPPQAGDEEDVNCSRYEAMDCECERRTNPRCCDAPSDEGRAPPEDGASNNRSEQPPPYGCYDEGYNAGLFFGQ